MEREKENADRQKNMLGTVEINHVQHISFTQSRLTDAVSVILNGLLSYEHRLKLGDLRAKLIIFFSLFLSTFPAFTLRSGCAAAYRLFPHCIRLWHKFHSKSRL